MVLKNVPTLVRAIIFTKKDNDNHQCSDCNRNMTKRANTAKMAPLKKELKEVNKTVTNNWKQSKIREQLQKNLSHHKRLNETLLNSSQPTVIVPTTTAPSTTVIVPTTVASTTVIVPTVPTAASTTVITRSEKEEPLEKPNSKKRTQSSRGKSSKKSRKLESESESEMESESDTEESESEEETVEELEEKLRKKKRTIE